MGVNDAPPVEERSVDESVCASFFFGGGMGLLACCLIAPHRGNNIRSALAAGGQGPRGTVARPTCVCCQCVSCSGLSQAVMGSFSFRVHALAVVLAYPRPLGRSQRLKQRRTLLLFTTITPTLVHSHLLQTPGSTTAARLEALWRPPLSPGKPPGYALLGGHSSREPPQSRGV